MNLILYLIIRIDLQEPSVVTTGTGAPIGIKDATLSVGDRGPLLLQDVNFLDELSHFDRERIPERVVHVNFNENNFFQIFECNECILLL